MLSDLMIMSFGEKVGTLPIGFAYYWCNIIIMYVICNDGILMYKNIEEENEHNVLARFQYE